MTANMKFGSYAIVDWMHTRLLTILLLQRFQQETVIEMRTIKFSSDRNEQNGGSYVHQREKFKRHRQYGKPENTVYSIFTTGTVSHGTVRTRKIPKDN